MPAQALLQSEPVQKGRLREHGICRRDLPDPGEDLEPQLHDLSGIQGPPDLIEAVQEPVVPDGKLSGIRQQPFRRRFESLHSLYHFFLVRIFGPDQPAVLLGGFQQVALDGALALVVGISAVAVIPSKSNFSAQNILQRSRQGMSGAVVDGSLVVDSHLHLRQIFLRNCRRRDPENVIPGIRLARNETEAVFKIAHNIAPSLSVMMGFPFR